MYENERDGWRRRTRRRLMKIKMRMRMRMKKNKEKRKERGFSWEKWGWVSAENKGGYLGFFFSFQSMVA